MNRTRVPAFALAICSAACVTTKSAETIVSGTMTKIEPQTTRGTFTVDGNSRDYVAYRPATFPVNREERALIVMLHGCTQTADDFAKGTRMNSVADSGAFLVLYPEQSAKANAQKCWNWYTPGEFARGHGEAALLAAMIDSVAKAEGIGAQHVSLVGMSAGAAMAANMVVAYPERYAALAVHSGIPALAASDMTAALAAMRDGAANANELGARALTAMGSNARAVPVIVLHGEADKVVSVANAHATVAQFTAVNASATSKGAGGKGAVGKRAVVEEHVFPGIGHAWSGGSPDGTYTAPNGPNASLLIAAFLRKVGAIQ